MRKRVINDDGGNKVVADFQLGTNAGTLVFDTGDESPAGTFLYTANTLTGLSAGSKTLTEIDVAGYAEGTWGCTGGTGAVVGTYDAGSVVLNNGESVTCTIENNDQQGSLQIIKRVVNDNGGTAGVTAFGVSSDAGTLNFTGPVESPANRFNYTSQVIPVDAGSYTLRENDIAGYTEGTWSCSPTAASNSSINLGAVTVGNGVAVVCEITNNDIAPMLTLVKQVIRDNGGTAHASAWTLTAAGSGGFSGNGLPATGATASVGPNAVTAGVTYTLSESGGPAGYAASLYSCVTTPAGGPAESPVVGNSIALAIGASAVCTITNDDIQPSLTVYKFVINNSGGGATADQFTMTVEGTSTPNPAPTPASFPGSNSGTLVALNVGSVHVDELMPDGPQAYSKSYPASFTFNGQTITSNCAGNGNVTVGPGENKKCIVVNDDLAQTLVTSSSLCTFDVLPGDDDRDFRLLFTPSMQNPPYKLNATNPGQTFYNVFYAPDDPSGEHTITMTIPYPYVTHGATPVHIYGDDTVVRTVDGQQCITPGQTLGGRRDQIVLADYSETDNPPDGLFGESTTVDVTFEWPAGQDFVYINIHLDYGLKGTAPYAKGANDNAVHPTTLALLIPNHQCYTFDANNDVQLASDTVCSINSFKKNPGAGGLNRTMSEEPVPGALMELRNARGQLLTSQRSDEDGWYFLNYKHTGKAADFSIVSVGSGQRKTVTLKANAFAQVDFP